MPFPSAIPHEKLSIHITMLDISDLYLHEEIVPGLLDQLAQSIELDRCLKHPVVVDRKSLVVLDGTHRVAALEKLGCKRVPVYLVNYKNPAIKARCWYRTIRGPGALERIITQVKQMGLGVREVKKIDKAKVGVSPIVAAIKNSKKAFFICSSFRSLKEAYEVIKQIEEKLKKSAFEVGYETELDALCKLREQEVDAVLLTPKPTKGAIVDAALSGNVFLYKATRHVIPARPLYLSVPLSLLQNSESPLKKLNKELKRMLQKKRLKRVAAGSVVNGRRYEEELYFFEG